MKVEYRELEIIYRIEKEIEIFFRQNGKKPNVLYLTDREFDILRLELDLINDSHYLHNTVNEFSKVSTLFGMQIVVTNEKM